MNDEQVAMVIMGLCTSGIWIVCSYLALCLKCFFLSKGTPYKRHKIIIGDIVEVYSFIKNENRMKDVSWYVVSLCMGILGLLVSTIAFVTL